MPTTATAGKSGRMVQVGQRRSPNLHQPDLEINLSSVDLVEPRMDPESSANTDFSPRHPEPLP